MNRAGSSGLGSQSYTLAPAGLRADFVLTDQSASAVVDVCRQLDGIPLAVELAAARSAVLSPDQLAARLGDRFRLLVGGHRSAPPRQQTLRATLDWGFPQRGPRGG